MRSNSPSPQTKASKSTQLAIVQVDASPRGGCHPEPQTHLQEPLRVHRMPTPNEIGGADGGDGRWTGSGYYYAQGRDKRQS